MDSALSGNAQSVRHGVRRCNSPSSPAVAFVSNQLNTRAVWPLYSGIKRCRNIIIVQIHLKLFIDYLFGDLYLDLHVLNLLEISFLVPESIHFNKIKFIYSQYFGRKPSLIKRNQSITRRKEKPAII